MTDLEKALIAAQAELANPPKTATADTGRFRYSYAPLPEILDAVRPILNRHGLAIVQDVVGEGGYIGVLTTLIHGAGRLTSGPVMLPATDPQQAGSVITYLRRYSLCALLGIAADEDTDAKTSPAAGPAAQPAGVATTEERPRTPPQAGDTSPAASGEVAVRPEPGVGSVKTTPGSTTYPLTPDDCDHKFASGGWLKTRQVDGQARCPRCGMSAVVYRES